MRVNVFWKVERLIRDEGKNYGNLLRGKYSFGNELNNERIKYMQGNMQSKIREGFFGRGEREEKSNVEISIQEVRKK